MCSFLLCFSLPPLFTLVAVSISHLLTVPIKIFVFFFQRNLSPFFSLSPLALAISMLSMSGVVTKILSKNNNNKKTRRWRLSIHLHMNDVYN